MVLSGPELRLAGQRGPFLKGDLQVFMVPSHDCSPEVFKKNKRKYLQ